MARDGGAHTRGKLLRSSIDCCASSPWPCAEIPVYLRLTSMQVPLIQVDAFTRQAFSGNPAAVCPLLEWPADSVMQAIAAENNLSETAFIVPVPERYRLRWFTPTVEVALCGHATLAAAHVVTRHLRPELAEVAFETRSGLLTVSREHERLTMDFPSIPGVEATAEPALLQALGGPPPGACFSVEGSGAPPKFMLVYASAAEVASLAPDFSRLKSNVIVTADASEYDESFDFVSRFFAPASGVNEDPVTGSAHCTLTPYWAERLGKSELVGRQISKRGGTVYCKNAGERVLLGGYCADYLVGNIRLPPASDN